MLINTQDKITTEHVKFISYTGAYPNLCSGVLTLEIDGIEYHFGHDYTKWESWKTDGNFNKFWHSGGGITSDYCSYSGEWEIDVSELPEQFRQYATEIDEVFNENVPYGCCGGCI